MVLFVDASFDGDEIWHCLCPSCAAGWVREVACTNDPAEVVPLFEERGVNGPFGRNSQ
jgi:hypothetical protein